MGNNDDIKKELESAEAAAEDAADTAADAVSDAADAVKDTAEDASEAYGDAAWRQGWRRVAGVPCDMGDHIPVRGIAAMPVRSPACRLQVHLHVARHAAMLAPQLKDRLAEIRSRLEVPYAGIGHHDPLSANRAESLGP